MQKAKFVIVILRLIIGLVLLSLIILNISWIIDYFHSLKFAQGIEMNFIKSIKTIFYLTYLVTPILYFLSIFGYVYRKLIGWITLSNLFYFLLFDIFFIRIPSYSASWTDYLSLLIPLSLIAIMNLKVMRQIYKVNNRMIIVANLASILTSLIFVFVSGYLKLNYDLHMFEIIDKIG